MECRSRVFSSQNHVVFSHVLKDLLLHPLRERRWLDSKWVGGGGKSPKNFGENMFRVNVGTLLLYIFSITWTKLLEVRLDRTNIFF